MSVQPFNIRDRKQWLWFAIWFSLPLSIQLNSMAIVLAFVIFAIQAIHKPPAVNKEYLIYAAPPVLYFLVQLIPTGERLFNLFTLKEIEQQLPLLVFPMLFMFSQTTKKEFSSIASSALIFSVLLAGILMVSESAWRFSGSLSLGVFTYHSLAEPFDSGAVYFSFFILVVLLRMDEMPWLFKYKYAGLSAVLFLTVVLFLMASKLLLTFGIPFILIKHRHFIFRFLRSYRFALPVMLVLLLILIIPLTQRLSKIADANLEIVNHETYAYDSPLNGLNLRLIQLRLGIELLQENKAWLFGLGMDQAQELLNAKYIEKGMYTGYAGTEDTGYLNYNFHNQYMETLVRSGIVGFLSLLLIIGVLIKTARINKYANSWEIGIILLFFLTESVLERQIGIVYFCLLYSAYFPTKLKKTDDFRI